MAVVYHWKHGWIPLDHEAALSKAKGNHDLAGKMLEAAHGPATGIRSRETVAKAALDLPNVPASHRLDALSHLRSAAEQHNSTDLLPGHNGNVTRSSSDAEHQFQMNNHRAASAVKTNGFEGVPDAKLEALIKDPSTSESLRSKLQDELRRRRLKRA